MSKIKIGITLNQVEWFLKTFRKRLSKLRDVVEDADQMDANVPDGLSIWTQEQVDAELQRRDSAKTAASDDNT